MKSKYILALDQGTSSSRAVLFDETLNIVDIAQVSLQQQFPQSGWVEQDPEAIWESILSCIHEILNKYPEQASQISGIGITNQRETTIVWDRLTGRAIYPAIGWQDRRTADLCEIWKKEFSPDKLLQKTGLLFDPYFSATKLNWILTNVPGARNKAEQGDLLFGTIDTFLLWRLTGEHCTDATNAARTLLFNIRTQEWDQELLGLFDIPECMLPTVLDNAAEFGVTKSSLFGYRIPVLAMAGDQQAALIGQTCFNPGEMKITYGTGAFVVANIGTMMPTRASNIITTIAYRINGHVNYALEGSIFVAGSVIKWMRDQLHLFQNVSEIEGLLSQAHSSSNLYFIPAFTGLGAPYWRPDVRGSILGMDLNTSAADIVAAAIKGIIYQTRDVLMSLNQQTHQSSTLLRVDGGMAANDRFLQLLADYVDITVQRPSIIETTVLGVAYLVALQLGFYHSLDDIAAQWQCANTFTPNLDDAVREAEYMGWRKAINQVIR